ncbi:hypothetical protein [Asticcacaulis sp. AC402]|uniref:hypothetical protein n=1 Tax=Asticcacaulis sp. AC402 TaxID=1282361 RepID=UPI0003C3D539|nr:hypothetical protein ABAC402_16850 [Asticcacaulis sp. AC402]
MRQRRGLCRGYAALRRLGDAIAFDSANCLVRNAGCDAGGADTARPGYQKGGNGTMYSGTGNDTYYVQNTGDNVVEAGGAGNVNATGNSLANMLNGNDGNNTINGKGGADKLTGGLGADIFLFETGSGADTIGDFSAVQSDLINVNAYTGGVANAGMVAQAGSDVVITLGGGNAITVTGAVVADVLAHMVW